MCRSDAHFHLNMKKENPVKDMLDIIEEYQLERLVLILNTKEEAECFIRNYTLVSENISKIHIAVLMDINELDFFKETAKFLGENNQQYSVKLHSRISGITVADFEKIDSLLEEIEFHNIIVDAFYYGSSLANQVGVELAIYLAKKFQNKKIIIAHFGGMKIVETMLCTRDLKNIYYDISLTLKYFEGASFWKDVLYCAKYNANRTMFGTDYPMFTFQESVQCAKRLFEQNEGSTELYTKVMSTNMEYIYFGR